MLIEHKQYFYPLRLTLDGAALIIVFFLCSLITCTLFPGAMPPLAPGNRILHLPAYGNYFLSLLTLAVIVPLLLLYQAYLREKTYLQKLGERAQQAFYISCITGMCMLLLSIFSPQPQLQLLFILLWIPITSCLLIVETLLVVAVVRQRYRRGDVVYYVLMYGTNDAGKAAAQLFDAHPEWGIQVIGFLTADPGAVGGTCAGHPVLGKDDEFSTVVDSSIVDCVLWSGDVYDSTLFESLAHRCDIRGIDFIYTSSMLNEKFAEIMTEQLGDQRLLIHKSVYHHPAKLFIKRFMDVVLASLLIVIATPLWIIVPIIIRLDSPGPALFRQERVGRHGRRFIMYKFRSMVQHAEQLLPQVQSLNEMDGPVFKIIDDPRFTRLGKFLRKTSIDELPQLFNVLKGEMSLVGPRPPLYSEVLRYSPWQRKRLSVTPGITCLWQVSGRNKIKFDEWMQLDLQYINNWSLLLDVKILLKTILAVLSQKGAQ